MVLKTEDFKYKKGFHKRNLKKKSKWSHNSLNWTNHHLKKKLHSLIFPLYYIRKFLSWNLRIPQDLPSSDFVEFFGFLLQQLLTYKVKSERVSHSVVSDPLQLHELSSSSVHGISQARILEWVAICFSRGSSQPRDWTWVFCAAGRFFTSWATREVLLTCKFYPYIPQNCGKARDLSLGKSLQGPWWENLSTHNIFWLHPWPWVLKSAKGSSSGDRKAERNNCWGATTGLAQYLVLSHPPL